MSDIIAILSYVLAAIALAWFALEFVFTRTRDRICDALKAALHR